MSSVGVVFGGLSPEHDISILTGLQAARLLSSSGHEVVCIYWTRAGSWMRVPTLLEGNDFAGAEVSDAAPLALRVPDGFVERRRRKETSLDLDVVVNCCHGGPGEDGTLTALLQLAGIRVTGPSSDVACWAMDKYASSGIVSVVGLDRFGIETIPTLVITGELDKVDAAPPWVVKPRFGGSSVGVEVGVEDIGTAIALSRTGVARGGAVLQPQLSGWSDLNVAVRAFPEPQMSAIERPLTAGAYGYAEKYLAGADGMESAKRELPAAIPEDVRSRIEQASLALVASLGVTGVPRVDFLYDGQDRLALCEINSVPGSLGLYLWAAAGLDRAQVVLDLIDEALKAPPVPPHWSSSTDGAALRAASSVAAKLR